MGKAYGYVKTNVDVKVLLKQVEQMKELGVAEDDLYSDASSDGAQSKVFADVLGKLERGDLLVVSSADCLGFNLGEIHETWEALTRDAGVDVAVADMPLLDSRKGGAEELGLSVSDVAMQTVAYMNGVLRASAKRRQAEGIAKAKARGVKLGHKMIPVPANVDEVLGEYESGKIVRKEAAAKVGVSLGTFDRWRREARERGSSSSGYKSVSPP